MENYLSWLRVLKHLGRPVREGFCRAFSARRTVASDTPSASPTFSQEASERLREAIREQSTAFLDLPSLLPLA